MKATKHVIDLHVHTPASVDWQGPTGRKGYLDLISAYKAADVSAIAVTDHNTVRGYSEYCRLRDATRLNYELNSSREDAGELLKQLKAELLSFTAVTVFPGVEVSIYPGIHLIIIFDEEVPSSEIATFLREDLMLGDAEETGDPAVLSQLTPTAALDKAVLRFKNHCFSILPHVDSSKGAWNELEGASRAQLFTHPLVLAAQVVNPDSRRRLETALANEAYQRDTRLQIIQASDYHGSPSSEPGSQHTILETEGKLSFSTLRNHLLHDGALRISADSIDDALVHFTTGRRTLAFDFQNEFTVSPELRRELLKALCGVLNTRASALRLNFFNLQEEPSITAEKLKDLIKEIRLELDPPDFFPFRLLDFSYSQARQRFVVQVKDNLRIRLYEGVAYAADSGDIRPARAWEIERQVSRNFYSRYGKTKQDALVSASKSLLMISNSLPAFSIASRVDELLKSGLPKGIKTKFEKPGYDFDLEPDKDTTNVNGVVDGDYYLLNQDLSIKGGRLEQNAYYRFSMPSFSDQRAKADKIETLETPENCVIICPEGGVNFTDKSKRIYAPYPLFFLTAPDLEPEGAVEMLLGLAAYLKSSFVLWYITTIYESDDLFEVLMRSSGDLLMPKNTDGIKRLATFVRNILIAESAMLRLMAKSDKDPDRERVIKEVNKHNAAAARNMRLIDREVFRLLQAEGNEIREIYRVLAQLGLHDYDIGAELDTFIKELEAPAA